MLAAIHKQGMCFKVRISAYKYNSEAISISISFLEERRPPVKSCFHLLIEENKAFKDIIIRKLTCM